MLTAITGKARDSCWNGFPSLRYHLVSSQEREGRGRKQAAADYFLTSQHERVV